MGVVIPVWQQMGICEEKTDLAIYEQFQYQVVDLILSYATFYLTHCIDFVELDSLAFDFLGFFTCICDDTGRILGWRWKYLEESDVPIHLQAIIGPSRTLSSAMYVESKRVRVWTESKQVMVATVKRGWKTLVLGSKSHELADEWSSMH
ncbi:uncharacterized protein [Malus domestica]|uniref:uncharacterized protein isoform X2 n=1 Tax=Malus domestica TaxID=3750 RepID=UPI003975A4B3